MLVSFALITCCGSVCAQSDPRISEIRRRNELVNAQTEPIQEPATTFLNELVINKTDAPFPAVGIYRTVAKFYYTFGNRERNPYPDRLLKIMIATDRSNRKESSEYLFNDAGQLILFSEKTEDFDHRVYFVRERAIGFEKGGRLVNLRNSEVAATSARAIKEKAQLVAIFRGSLRL
jgi:hypothetical protein